MIGVATEGERRMNGTVRSRLGATRMLLAVCLALAAMSAVGVSGAQALRSDFPEFGFASAGVEFTGPDGSPMRQAGSHPDITTRFELKTVVAPSGGILPASDLRDIHVELPPGVVGNPNAQPTCKYVDLVPAYVSYPECPIPSQIGYVRVYASPNTGVGERAEADAGLYNMEHGPDVPGAFAFNYAGTIVKITPRVRPGDYGIDADSDAISEGISAYGVKLTFWGVPGDPSHDSERLNPAGFFGTPDPATRTAFMTYSTGCTEEAAKIGMRADSWGEPGRFVSAELFSDPLGVPYEAQGCDRLAFEPSMRVATISRVAGAPTGLDVNIDVPQSESPDGLATSDVKSVSVNLPAGLSVSPSAATGLGACTSSELELYSESVPTCPESSKIGTVEIESALLPEPLKGDVILAQPHDNPFNSLLAMYVVAKGPGVEIKIPGRINIDPATGQLNATFAPAPQLPFTKLRMKLNGGSRAPLVTPRQCGTYTTNYEIQGWSGKTVTGSTPFSIDQNCGGGFAPNFTGGTVNNQAGAFSPLVVEFARGETDQALRAVSVTTPPGLAGVIKNVAQCPEAQASSGTCSAASAIGHVTVGAGPDPDPFSIGGQVYLTGPYEGAPFGLAIAVPAVAGPFDLGTVLVRAKIEIDPHTAALTIVSDPFPTILEGIPLDVRTIDVDVDRANFMFNPTSCSELSLGATMTSEEGASVARGTRFEASNCAELPFKPKFSASTGSTYTRASGASLDVKLTAAPGEANVGRVKVEIPKALPSRLTTIQKACVEATFDANPGSCPVGSLVGMATATTPILAHALSGPAYLVSHGGAAFPDLDVVLQGEGITVILTGSINIKGGVTTSTFGTVPDVPVTAFELKLPTGPHSALTANVAESAHGKLCGQKFVMPTTMVGQNGVQLQQSTKIAVTGCGKAKKAKTKAKKVKSKAGKKAKGKREAKSKK
jgi:hypothetical protein